jgi:small-conductance mechanosensitive channel
MKIISSTIFCLFFISLSPAQDNQNKIFLLNKTDAVIQLDGFMDPVWTQADTISDFVQFEPYYAQKPSCGTAARFLTTADALYCLITCYDEKKNLQTNKGKLDNIYGDHVEICLDTFGDEQTAYKFAVSCSGVRSDSRLLDDARNVDYSWDGVWFAAARVYEWGYIVEMKIPYKSIQYNENLAEWGLDISRWIPTRTESDNWCNYEQNEADIKIR